MTMTIANIVKFVKDNLKVLLTVAAFLVTMYVQHVTSISRIDRLEEQCATLEVRLAEQYDRIDAIKLDKAVFEATMTQFTSIQSDLREMRRDIKELLKTQR